MAEASGAEAHYRALERLYGSAPINNLFDSVLEIPGPGLARIRFDLDERHFHAAGAVHGTSYFKMLDDAAYAANSLVSDRFLLTTAFNLLFTKPLKAGPVIAEGKWVSGQRRVYVAEARLIDSTGEEAARGTGTFMRSHIPLAGLPGYRLTRLASGLLVNALVRRVNDAGGSAMVAKGDPDSGAILIVATHRGTDPQCFERGWDDQSRPALVATGPTGESAITDYWQRRRERDRDLWVVELDSAEAKRFAAETIIHD